MLERLLSWLRFIRDIRYIHLMSVEANCALEDKLADLEARVSEWETHPAAEVEDTN